VTSGVDLSIVIPTRDRWPVLARTLEALRRQTVSGFEVVVVVDGEDQQPPPLDDVRVVQVPHGGPGIARNAGTAATSRSLLLFLGDDMVPRPDLVARHLAAHTRRPGVEDAVLGHVEWHPETDRTPLRHWVDATGMQFDFASTVGDDAGWARFYSCNVSLTRELFTRVSGFDPDFAFYYEDLDAGWRLGQAGMRLTYERDAVVDHLHSYDEAGYARRLAGIATGERMMMAKHPWFVPWFAERFRGVEDVEPLDPVWRSEWPWRVPGRIGALARERAALAWRVRFAPDFLDAFEGEEELAELKAYLGDSYDEHRLRAHQSLVEHEEHAAPDERTFYRTSEAYLYDLTVFAMSGTKRPYRRMVRRLVPPGGRVLDYGCGIGSDGLRLIADGRQVEFADFANPSVAYLRWRLEQRGWTAAVHDVELSVPQGFDAVTCFDVLEHVDDPFAFLAHLESLADLVIVNLLEPAPDDVHLHRPLPVKELIEHAVSQGLVSYRFHHGRSHLLAYRSGRATPVDQALGRAKLLRDRARQARARA
jgi:glycosyltransferase involved in cell wall biosynthesis